MRSTGAGGCTDPALEEIGGDIGGPLSVALHAGAPFVLPVRVKIAFNARLT